MAEIKYVVQIGDSYIKDDLSLSENVYDAKILNTYLSASYFSIYAYSFTKEKNYDITKILIDIKVDHFDILNGDDK